MEIPKLIPIVLILIAFLLTVTGIFLPWWDIQTTRGAEALNATARADYGVWQTVSASRTAENETISVFLSLGNLTKSGEDINAWNSLFNVFLGLTAGGMIMTIISVTLLIFYVFRKPSQKFGTIATILSAVAGILLLVAPFYIAATAEPLIAKLSSVMPIDIPTQWVSIAPKDIGTFWGSKPIPETSAFPKWIQGRDFWIWGAGFGWYLIFISGLLVLASVILIRQVLRE